MLAIQETTEVSQYDDFDDLAAAEGSQLGDRVRAAGLRLEYQGIPLDDYQLGALMIYGAEDQPCIAWAFRGNQEVGWVNIVPGGWQADPESELISAAIGQKYHDDETVEQSKCYVF